MEIIIIRHYWCLLIGISNTNIPRASMTFTEVLSRCKSMSFGTVSGLGSPWPFCLLKTAWVRKGKIDRQKLLYKHNQASSHLSLLLGLLGTCLPASAQSSPSEGCLNLNRLKETTVSDADEENTLNENHRIAVTLTCHCTGASVQKSNAEPFSALCWLPANWPPTEFPSVPIRKETNDRHELHCFCCYWKLDKKPDLTEDKSLLGIVASILPVKEKQTIIIPSSSRLNKFQVI